MVGTSRPEEWTVEDRGRTSYFPGHLYHLYVSVWTDGGTLFPDLDVWDGNDAWETTGEDQGGGVRRGVTPCGLGGSLSRTEGASGMDRGRGTSGWTPRPRGPRRRRRSSV